MRVTDSARYLKKSWKLFLVFFFALSGADSFAEKRAQISLDPKLLKDLSGGGYPCRGPFKVTYSKGGKSLAFIAADHVWGATPESDPRLARVKQEIEKFRPEGIVIERPVSRDAFSKDLDREIKECQRPDGKFICGEPTYAGIMAAKLGATVVGGEKTKKEMNAEALKGGLSREEVLVYNSILILSSMREQRISAADRRTALKNPSEREMLLNDPSWSFEKFEAWTRKNLGVSADDVETSWIEPRNDVGASASQKIAYRYDAVREPLILKAIEGVLNSKNRTMVVYGSGHWVKQSAAYAKALGAPRIDCFSGGGPISSEEREFGDSSSGGATAR